MKYTVHYSSRFKKSLKRAAQFRGFKKNAFKDVVSDLACGKKLDKSFKDHQLKGEMKSFRECHISPDILLIYQIDDEVLILTLVNIGSHSQLFE